jgi:membrane protein YqaA with SNARE-associated domain
MIYEYLSLFLISFGAATIIPVASEPVFAYMIASGGNATSLVAAATIGNWTGGLTTYGLGFIGKWEKVSGLFGIKPEKAEKWRQTVAEKGAWMALLCWCPVIGDVIALALGLARANPFQVCIFMLAGKFSRYLFIAYTVKGFMR